MSQLDLFNPQRQFDLFDAPPPPFAVAAAAPRLSPLFDPDARARHQERMAAPIAAPVSPAPAADIFAADEMSADGYAAWRALAFIDAAHRARCIDSLRRLRERRADMRSESQKRKYQPLSADDVQWRWEVTRCRSLDLIAADAWLLVDLYDRANRAGEAMPRFHMAMDRLRAEANEGTTFGLRVNRGPARLLKMLRVRARREGRLPMWGITSKIRFQCRGMHIIADFDGLSMRVDPMRHRPGDASFSSTGFRSFISTFQQGQHGQGQTPEDFARWVLESFIDAPAKNGNGLGGKLERWIPWHAQEWARVERDRRGRDEAAYRRDYPAMTPADERPAYWAALDAKQTERHRQLLAEGIDLAALFPDLAPPPQAALF